ncbi:Glycoside hydrolase family 61 [Pyrenophora seminiperda CCB06]|uniref:AA9 family lytic polysaccharide monooxygenase n=1 Tax=Pyrenophora seminiperda CCB06 TaxID=1302712 RepID=A0A3M7M9Z8_9PLEO|nr:Glycoside hydrolase family 61 [Pyrenophora seminiperda CCB06]
MRPASPISHTLSSPYLPNQHQIQPNYQFKMKFSVLAAATIAQVASAHYFWDKVFMDGKQVGQPSEYIRKNTRSIAYMPTKWKNTFDNLTPDDNDFRCNFGSFKNAANTKVLEVKAGTTLAMGLGVGASMKHPGSAHVHMSMAPGNVQQYEGDGEWFKIFEEGMCDKSKSILTDAWCTWGKDRVEFKIPEATPKGDYLVRAEHIAIHGAHVGEAELYYGCLQVRITEGGNGTPGPTYKFPGAYKKTDPSFNFSIYGGMKDYPMPGPRPWTGGNGSNSSSSGTPTEQSSTSSPSPVSPVAGKNSPVSSPPSDYEDYPSSPSPAKPVADAVKPVSSPQSYPKDPTQLPPVHNSDNCKGDKKKRGRRAFREAILKA